MIPGAFITTIDLGGESASGAHQEEVIVGGFDLEARRDVARRARREHEVVWPPVVGEEEGVDVQPDATKGRSAGNARLRVHLEEFDVRNPIHFLPSRWRCASPNKQ